VCEVGHVGLGGKIVREKVVAALNETLATCLFFFSLALRLHTITGHVQETEGWLRSGGVQRT